MSKLIAKKIREEFPMLAKSRSLAYLDSAASSQTPKSVIAAVNGYYRGYRANVHRGLYPASERATDEYEQARQKLARFVNADIEETIFTRGTTESLNLVASIMESSLRPGDEVVMTVMEHHSNLIPWQQLAKRRGLKLKFIGLTGSAQLDLKQAKRLIGPKTKVVSLIHVSNALGTVVPIKRLVAMARRVKAVTIVDAAQSAGHRPLDVKDIGCDFLALSGHKMFGPTGIGLLYGRRQLLERLPPYLYGGDMIARVSFEESEWNELPWKFEAGTPNIAGAIGFGAAADFVERLGIEKIQKHEAAVTEYALERLSAIGGIEIYGPPSGRDRGGLVSFGLTGMHPHDLSGILGGQKVCVRGGHHCAMPLMRLLGLMGTTRASFSVYNDSADVRALVSAVKRAKQTFRL
jgi:cysteine desulfurase/selenocysteine lyase